MKADARPLPQIPVLGQPCCATGGYETCAGSTRSMGATRRIGCRAVRSARHAQAVLAQLDHVQGQLARLSDVEEECVHGSRV